MDFAKLYEYFIVLFHLNSYKNLSKLAKEYDLNEIYNYVYTFWCDNFDRKLDLSNEEDQVLLFDFLNNIFRYTMLNDLVDELYTSITDEEKDIFILSNYKVIHEIVRDSLGSFDNKKNEETKLTKLSHEDLDELFKEFLLTIDKNGDFLKVYEDLKTNGSLIYTDILSKEKKDYIKSLLKINDNEYDNYFLRTEEHGAYVVIDRKEDLSDFRTLTHEFMHYYTYSKNKEKKPYFLLLEFPSIFYEYVANRFLLKKGYSMDDIKSLLLYRFDEFNKKSSYLTPINYYLKLYIDSNKNITDEIDEEKTKELITSFIESNGEEEYKKALKENSNIANPKLFARDNCDIANYYLNIYPHILVNNYPYLIGNYLALDYVSQLVENEITLDDMKKIAEDLPNIDPNIILDVKNRKEKNNKQLQKEKK